ncbi:MAG: ATP-binding protein, partial [Sediminibacterium sp.]
HSTLTNLLRWSLSQFQGIKAVPEKIALDEVIEKNAILFKQPLERKHIRFVYQPTGLFVMADPDHLMLVLRNLVSNAIKYSYPDSFITINCCEKGGRIIIEVADTGVGMNDEIKKSIFSSSPNMVSSTGTSNEKGTGLGLKLCKEFIEKNNGQIWLDSIEQKGSRFYISLPVST